MKNQSRTLILIVEDEPAQMELIAYNLEQAGFDVARAAEGDEGLEVARDIRPDLIILDWMLPNTSGIEVCRQLKRQKALRNIPVIMLTARGEEGDRVRGFETGADDFVVKPYSMKELLARIKALLRRTRPGGFDEILEAGDLVLNGEQHKVTRNGKKIKLGPIEFELLRVFMDRPKRVWSRSRLLDRVWGIQSHIDDRTVDVHIGRLRKALRQSGQNDPIRTVRGAGYSFDPDD